MAKLPSKTFDELAGTEQIAQQLMKETVIDDLRFNLRVAQKQAGRISKSIDNCVDPKESMRLDKELYRLLREIRLTAAQIVSVEKDCRRRANELGESEGAMEYFKILKSDKPPEVSEMQAAVDGLSSQLEQQTTRSHAPPAA
ncbi:MAG: hypothetical protein ACYTDT_13595 [Planctomycetota bacterium]|jgi:hypothetical protein